jgi:hypothetical protein
MQDLRYRGTRYYAMQSPNLARFMRRTRAFTTTRLATNCWHCGNAAHEVLSQGR